MDGPPPRGGEGREPAPLAARHLALLVAVGIGLHTSPRAWRSAIGHTFTSPAMSVVFLTLAAGSIVYVVIQLLSVAAKARKPDIVAWGLLAGLLAGFVTDAVVTAGGA